MLKLSNTAEAAVADRSEEEGSSGLSAGTKALLAALAAGGIGYGLSRRSTIHPTNKALARLQRRGAEHGFHRVIDVTPAELAPGATPLERFKHFIRPQADKDGRLGRLDRLKLWLQEGDEAIPVLSDGNKTYFATPEGKSETPRTVNGLVWGRNFNSGDGPPARFILHGGMNAEGPPKTQRALTQLAGQGKGVEAQLLAKYAPDAIPETVVGVPHVDGTSMADKVRALQSELKTRFKGDDFLLKTTDGVASSGALPRGAGDWGAQLDAYRDYLRDPEKQRLLSEANRKGANALSEFLRKNNIYEGSVLYTAAIAPEKILAQRLIPNTVGEWRVHSIAGAAPQDMMVPRFHGAAEHLAGLTGRKAALQKFVEEQMSKLPPKYRDGTFGLDVMEHRDAAGNPAFKFVEMNPTGRASPRNAGQVSGMLLPHLNPGIGHAHYKLLTGRHTRPMALRNALLAGGGVGGAAYGAQRLLADEQPTEEPSRKRAPRRHLG